MDANKMAETKLDVFDDSLKSLKDNLPSILTMITIKKDFKMRDLLITFLFPVILKFLQNGLTYLRERRLKLENIAKKSDYKARIDIDVKVISKNYVVEFDRAIVDFFDKISSLEKMGLVYKKMNGFIIRGKGERSFGSYITGDGFYQCELNKEGIKKYIFLFNKYNIPEDVCNEFKKYSGVKLAIEIVGENSIMYGPSVEIIADIIDIISTFYSYKGDIEKGGKRFYYEMSNKKIPEGIEITFKRGLDKIFLRKESQLRERLLKWKGSQEFYKDHDLPHKMGLMLYGEPGTGKTSLAYSIAIHFSFNLYRINLDKCESFDWLFELILGNKDSVFLIDEFDRVLDRLKEPLKKEIIIEKEGKEEKEFEIINNRDKELTLQFLKLLEDIRLQSVIIIFTTNKTPEDFDPALIRPGRIDYCERLGKCTTEQFEKMFKEYCIGELPKDYVFPNEKYSPAYVINTVLVPYRDDIEKICELLS